MPDFNEALKRAEEQNQALDRQKALVRIVSLIRRSYSLSTICQTAVDEIRQLLGLDRAAIYQFKPDWSGNFIFESVTEGWKALIGTIPDIEDTYLMETRGGRYKENETFAIADIYQAGHQDCHVKLLEEFQARAYAIAPIFRGKELWGLLAAYQNEVPRGWREDEVELLAQLGEQLGVALQQAEEQKRAIDRQQVIDRQKALVRIVSKIRNSFSFSEICQTATDEVQHLLHLDRTTIFRFNPDWSGNFIFESVAEGWKAFIGNVPVVKDTNLMETRGGRYRNNESFAVADIYEAGYSDCHVKLLEEFQARAYAIAPIFRGKELWGLLTAYQNDVPREWREDEVELLAQLGEQLGVALQQSEEQKQAIDRQKALVRIVSKIRNSFSFSEICQTATDEVQHLLHLDRTTIFRFNPDWSGNFIFESVAEGWKAFIGNVPVVKDTNLMATRGGRYRNNETFAIADIYEAGYSDCHVKLLEEFQARAYAIAPIFRGKELWGLLTAYQNDVPREWREDEVELLAQLGEQLGIALQQAESVEQIQSQSIQLQQALTDLKQSQMQLIQNEKMASLGQLVAGIAHEINNPINFIHGNLSHVNQYVDDLLAVLDFCQQYDFQLEGDRSAFQAQLEDREIEFLQEDLPQALKSMKIGTDRIRDIVLSLRNFSRLDEADIKVVNIHEGIENTLLILSHRLKAISDRPEIHIVKNYGEIPPIECYSAQLNQVFMNILANAIDALEEAIATESTIGDRLPTINITTSSPNDRCVKICISDNGIGIDKDNLSRIFDHFFTTKSIGKGTGLGLALSQQIITEKHGGSLSVNSTLGERTQFIIELPVILQASQN